MLPFEQGAMMYLRFRRRRHFGRVGPRIQPVPGSVDMVEVRLRGLDAVARDKLVQTLAMQDVENREGAPSRAHFFH